MSVYCNQGVCMSQPVALVDQLKSSGELQISELSRRRRLPSRIRWAASALFSAIELGGNNVVAPRIRSGVSFKTFSKTAA